jgi:hypothetical protein
MTPAARSVFIFGIYLLILGSMLIGAPNTLLSMFGLPPSDEVWIRVLGITVVAIGMMDMASGRGEQMIFIRATVRVRIFVFVALTIFAALKIAPPILIAFGLADVAGAIWTFLALRSGTAKA